MIYQHHINFFLRLSIESSDTSAVIKTPNKTYALRQKNTSNAFMLISPMSSSSSDESSSQGISIVSTIKETVELDVVPEKAKSAPNKGKWHERFGRNR
jgi:sister chromatid cohesion protein DCC1